MYFDLFGIRVSIVGHLCFANPRHWTYLDYVMCPNGNSGFHRLLEPQPPLAKPAPEGKH